MKFWKEKSRLPVLSVVFLLGLLVLLAGLQYKWLGQISDAEREHLQSRLQDDTKRFAEDFNREIQSVYFNFQIDAEDFRNQNWNAFNKRLINWNNQTQFPELIKNFYFVKKDDSQTVLRFDTKTDSFEKAEWTNDLRNISQKISAENEFNPILEEPTALAIPIFNRNDNVRQIIVRTKENPSENIKTESKIELPEKYGFLIIFLDENVIKNQIFPSLVSKYFSNADYKISIGNQANQKIFQTQTDNLDSPDSTVKLFNLKPNNFTFFRENGGGDLNNLQIGKRNKIVFNKNFSTKTVTSNKNEVLTVDIKKADEEKPRISIFESKGENSDGIWTLNVQHNDGSLEQFITNTRRRNLAVGFGILSVLAASIVLIYLSAQRAKLFAQRQIDFVSAVSHEFRTPLAVIYSAGENLSDGVIRNETKITDYGNLIKGEGKKLSAMVEQILEFAGANSGRKKYDLRETDVKEIVENAIAECQPLLKEKDFKLEKDIAENLSTISADAYALSGAIQNLITNAVKYGNGSNWLKISAHNGNGKIKIIVEDKGIGIDKGEINKIFEPFYRTKSVVDAQIHGNGLGLSLVKQTVEAHGGKVYVESEFGNGSRFTIHLPFII
ncbi:hypothetical protein BH20ACI1_BH20ACI1_20080 [soil metagenome]